MSYDYDVVVIGGGPGGYVAAIKAAQAGKKTAIIEKESLGGTCLNVGCIPTKALVKTVNVYEEILRSADFAIEGIDLSKVTVSMEKLQKRKQGIVRQLTGGVNALLKGNKVTILSGTARFADAHTVQIKEQSVTAGYFIIATGSETLMPGFIAYEGDTRIITSTEALSLQEIPESMVIIGGGVIGIEFAYIYAHLGTKVTVVELMEQILPMVDEDISKLARKSLEKAGVVFHTGAKVKKIKDTNVIFEKNGTEEAVNAEMTLMAVGRVPYTGELNAKGIGIAFDKKAIRTDEHMRTSVENIFAIGDVNGTSMLAHTASHEGITAVENILGEPAVMSYDAIPSCIYIEPEIASIGLTQKQAEEKYENIKVGKFPMSANGKSLIEGETGGMIKVILDGDLNEILGVHMFCVHATDMIAEVSAAMNLEASAEEVLHAVHPHPTVSEAVMEAFMSAYDKAVHAM
ncbi:Dihydrolipoyl dehydrogenase [uncultured Roseburia sp.]|uniref:Dihydrolipoyl dehydrogenase n=1 Tax=Brotonthovivens ammoniilytica TaxID=2981725 RepID=A0ABT2TH79_9FIRM|nr:dihydrolipoyl dehydrogenase [Brotonthovivens ammoniilytica]MCU6761071.1 dihydrolipoyl dehydrogenase [Brotonthovivens ammoniilytica]SCI18043.1 Dihydrolipoyl dehydrogenase [uncultured Roseburia sp.]